MIGLNLALTSRGVGAIPLASATTVDADEGTFVALTITGAPAGNWSSISQQPSIGVADVSGGGLRYDPDGDFPGLLLGATQGVSFIARHSNGRLYSITVTVNGVLVGTSTLIVAHTDTPYRRGDQGVTWAAGGTTVAAALAALDAATAIGAITSGDGSTFTLGSDGRVSADLSAVALADGEVGTDTFGVMAVAASANVKDSRRVLTVDSGTLVSGETYLRAAPTTTTALAVRSRYDAGTGYASRLVPGTAVRVAGTVRLFDTGGTPAQRRAFIRFRGSRLSDGVFENRDYTVATWTLAEATANSGAGTTKNVEYTDTLPATWSPAGIEVSIRVIDQYCGAEVTTTAVEGQLATQATINVTIIGGEAPAPAIRAADLRSSGDVAVHLDPDWSFDDGHVATVRAVRVSDSNTTTFDLPAGCGGLATVTGLSDGTAYDMAVSVDGGPYGPTWRITPTAESDTSLAVWADGQKLRELSARPTTFAGSAANLGTVQVVSGMEVEVDNPAAAGSKWRDTAMPAYKDPPTNSQPAWTNVPTTDGGWQSLYPAIMHVDPLWAGRTLAPLETSSASITTSIGTTSASILGAAGGFTWTAISAVGFDSNDNPITFRWGHPLPIGVLPDGRPFVVAPSGVTLRANSGSQLIPTDTIAQWQGAELCIVSVAGYVPHATTTVTLTTRYVRRRTAAANWSGWTDPVGSGTTAGLTLYATPESIHIHVDSSTATACSVRFRASDDTAGVYHSARDLDYDSRDPATWNSTNSTGIVKGRHRGVIQHLVPGVTYLVQVKQGSSYWEGSATTTALAPPKVSAAVPFVDGDITISRSGDTVTLVGTGISDIPLTAPAGTWAEFRDIKCSGLVRVTAARTILTRPDVRGSDEDAIQIAATDVIIARARGQGWGNMRARYTDAPNNTNPGWAENGPAIIRTLSSDDGVVARLAVVGLCGLAPRWSANPWTHKTAVTSPTTGSNHTYGAQMVNILGYAQGQVSITDAGGASTFWRYYGDCMGSTDDNFVTVSGSWNANSLIAWNWLHGAADDGIEFDGPNVCVAAHSLAIAYHDRQQSTTAMQIAVSCGAVVWGPAYFSNIVVDARQPDPFTANTGSDPSGNRRFWKIDRFNGGLDLVGRIYLDCCATYRPPTAGGVAGRSVLNVFSDVDTSLTQISGRNNRFYASTSQEAALQAEGTNSWPSGSTSGSNLITTSEGATNAMDSDYTPATGATALEEVTAAAWIGNVNDGGPWGLTGGSGDKANVGAR